MEAFKAGDKAYIVESNRIVRQCTVVRENAGMYLIRFENGGGIQVKGHRLFASQEQAEKSVLVIEKKVMTQPQTGYRSPYDYWH